MCENKLNNVVKECSGLPHHLIRVSPAQSALKESSGLACRLADCYATAWDELKTIGRRAAAAYAAVATRRLLQAKEHRTPRLGGHICSNEDATCAFCT
jgi:hypothetical protein